MDINELKQEMMLDGEQESEIVEAAVNKCTCVKTLQERKDIGQYVKNKELVKKIQEGKDGLMKMRAKSAHAFETLKYVFDSSAHPVDNVLENTEREIAFLDWCHCFIDDWKVIETDEGKKEITLKKSKTTR